MKNLSNIKNIVPKQLELLKKLTEEIVDLSFEWNEVRGTASFIRGSLLQANLNIPELSTDVKTYKGSTIEKAVVAFMSGYRELFLPSDKPFTYRLNRIQKDDINFLHAEYDLLISNATTTKVIGGDIPVFGSKLIFHFNADGNIVEIQSSCYRDIEVSNTPKIKDTELQEILMAPIKDLKGYAEFKKVMGINEKNFPLLGKPNLALYPWKEKFLYTWITFGYGLTEFPFRLQGEENAQKDEIHPKKLVDNGMAVIDAATGEILYFAPDRKGTEINTAGAGLGVVPLGNPAAKNLKNVQDDVSMIYLLKNKLNARDVLTYDANDSPNYGLSLLLIFTSDTVGDGIVNGGLLISEDNNNNWDRLPLDASDTQRTLGQQPETDAHHFCTELYEWYDALAGGRAGWDNNQFTAPLVPSQPVNVVVHVRFTDLLSSAPGSPRWVNAFFNKKLIGNQWISYLVFFDGDPGGTPPYDYMAGSRFIVSHEYQHAMTDFNFKDANGNPGLTYSGWLSAVHEGLSDTFAGLFSEQWWPGSDISSTATIFRNIAFPRDTNAFDSGKLDHFDDRSSTTDHYARGTILAHCAYLTGQGGVHQRSSRNPVLIPVYSLGKENRNGKEVLKAARIWYRAVTYYLSTHGALTAIPNDDENVFRTIRDGCVSAAIDIYGAGSIEHKTTELAFYAIGLHPTGTNYGPDVTFLRWGASWWMSRPYIGINSPDWSSVDLFINNGGTSEWNAIINILDSMGNPTNYENSVYCRVRNVGDQPANNVTVTFEYAKAGTGSVTWNPMLDINGNPATLNIGTLAAGTSNFSDADQNIPPASARVKWYIAPLGAGEVVHHFCIRAHVTSSNEVNTYNNDTQSNVGYIPYTAGMPIGFGFMVGNPKEKREVQLQLKIANTLPEKWKVELKEDIKALRLKPGEEKQLTLMIDMPKEENKFLKPPFDGEIKGEIYGTVCGPVTGMLTGVKVKGKQIKGTITLQIEQLGKVIGNFSGKIDPESGKVAGKIMGQYTDDEECRCKFRIVGFRGCLRPFRRINIMQFINGEAIGGITIQVQVPLPEGSFFENAPSANVFYSDKLIRKQ
jgi:Zn-dependent metalloprotease